MNEDHKKDYEAMRDFQFKFIGSDLQNRKLRARIATLEAENAKLRAVVEAAKELVQEHYIDATCKNCTGETNHVEQLLENLERLETTNG